MLGIKSQLLVRHLPSLTGQLSVEVAPFHDVGRIVLSLFSIEDEGVGNTYVWERKTARRPTLCDLDYRGLVLIYIQ